jgi:DNA-binding transcriptional ArsR family regulator
MLMQQAARQAGDLMKALSNENRLMILCQLAEGEKSVGELAALLELPQPSVSQQLALMKSKRLVASRKVAQTVRYTLAGDAATRVIAVLYDLFCAPLETQEKSKEPEAACDASDDGALP